MKAIEISTAMGTDGYCFTCGRSLLAMAVFWLATQPERRYCESCWREQGRLIVDLATGQFVPLSATDAQLVPLRDKTAA